MNVPRTEKAWHKQNRNNSTWPARREDERNETGRQGPRLKFYPNIKEESLKVLFCLVLFFMLFGSDFTHHRNLLYRTKALHNTSLTPPLLTVWCIFSQLLTHYYYY